MGGKPKRHGVQENKGKVFEVELISRGKNKSHLYSIFVHMISFFEKHGILMSI